MYTAHADLTTDNYQLDLGHQPDSNKTMLISILLVSLAYLAGSLSTAIMICKLMGLDDPRTQGSNNPGATNVLRLHGKKVAAMTFLGDMLKGLLPVLIADYILRHGNNPYHDLTVALTGLAAFCGHLYPVFFGFRGGKGVATVIGILFGMHWPLGLVFITVWLLVAAMLRISSLAALVAALAAPVAAFMLHSPYAYTTAISVMATLIFWRHRSNIRNLIAGTEDRIGQ